MPVRGVAAGSTNALSAAATPRPSQRRPSAMRLPQRSAGDGPAADGGRQSIEMTACPWARCCWSNPPIPHTKPTLVAARRPAPRPRPRTHDGRRTTRRLTAGCSPARTPSPGLSPVSPPTAARRPHDGSSQGSSRARTCSPRSAGPSRRWAPAGGQSVEHYTTAARYCALRPSRRRRARRQDLQQPRLFGCEKKLARHNLDFRAQMQPAQAQSAPAVSAGLLRLHPSLPGPAPPTAATPPSTTPRCAAAARMPPFRCGSLAPARQFPPRAIPVQRPCRRKQ